MKKLSLRHILVPIDFSELSLRAIETAQQLARPFGATIHLVHVHEYHYLFPYMAPGESMPLSITTFLDEAEERAAHTLKKWALDYELSPDDCYIREGFPVFHEICELAREKEIDFIVMPTHGRTGLKHLFLGSVAERVVQHAPCPVLIQRKPPQKTDRILVPVDFSNNAFAGLQYAIRLADKFAAKIFLLHVADLGYVYAADGTVIYDIPRLEESAKESAELQMQQFVRRTHFGDVKFETAVRVGHPVDGICDFAQDEKIDLIIASTHGRTGLPHMLMGSTSEQIVRRATRPVLIVPSHPEARARQAAQSTRALKKKEPAIPPTNEPVAKPRNGKIHAFPERRLTNKFRESHQTATS